MKKILVQILFLTIIFNFQSCKKEIIDNEKNDISHVVKKLNYDEIQKNKRLSTILNSINDKNIEINNNYKTNDLFNFIVVTTEANLYIDDNGKYQYTFPVYREQPNDSIQENVLLIIKPNQEAEAYLLQYHLTESEFQNFIDGQLVNNPNVDITPIDYDMLTNKSCIITFEAVYNVVRVDNCCRYIQYVGVEVTYYGDCDNTGAFSTINDFGNDYVGPPEGGGGVPFSSSTTVSINSFFEPNGTLGLTQQQSDWINNNGTLKFKLITYLIDQNFSQQAQDFVKLIIELQVSDVNDINFDDCIIFRNTLSNDYPFFANVFREVDALSSNIIETSRSIFDNDYNISVLIDAINLSSGTAAITLPYQTVSSQNKFITYFDTGTLDECTDIFAAVTYIHERIHAILLYAAATNQISVTNLSNASFEDLLDAYANFIQTNNSTYNGVTHHEIIATYYVNEIADALEEWGNNNNYNLSSEFYHKLAWTGLLDTSFFNTDFHISIHP